MQHKTLLKRFVLQMICTFCRPIAVGALLTTFTACLLTMIQISLDVSSNHVQCNESSSNSTFDPVYPPPTFSGYFAAFGSIMFAFGGASTFPTIQVDMKDRSR